MRVSSLCKPGTAEARQFLPGAVLAGGYRVGDRVVSRVAHQDQTGTLSVGDEGTVRGPCDNDSLDNAAQRVVCEFPRCPSINVLVSQLCKPGTAEAQQ